MKKELKIAMKPKIKLSQKIMIALFMECVPQIIEMWKSKGTDLTFDTWLLSVCEEHKKSAKK